MAESRALEILANTLQSLFVDNDTMCQSKHKDIADEIANWLKECTDSVPTLKSMEQVFSMSHTKLGFIFKKEKGKSIFAFYRDIRLQRALILLQNKEISITNIAQVCGFSSSSHFTASFKQHYHLTPSQYRKKLNHGAQLGGLSTFEK